MKKAIVDGLGAMGSSIAENLKSNRFFVTGIDPDPDTIETALIENVINVEGHFDEATVADADVIVLSAHVPYIIEAMELLKKLPVKENAVIVDIGSTKTEIMKHAEGLDNFIGGHPMIGTDQEGIDNRNKDMFIGAPFFLVGKQIVATRASSMLKSLGSIFQLMSAEEHDRLISGISDLPHIVAFAMTDSVDQILPNNQLTWQQRVAGGFKDTTRIANSSPDLWTGILMTNQEQVLTAMDTMIDTLKDYRAAIADGDTKVLNNKLTNAQEIREQVGESKND
ncbi:prephenate dehydrogenase [Companilactobacillus mishanensis]|uniref:Prephenate dehydrogenase n=1 Tax=Companilactobacillus mishanensis TaxID=2486008 RepID=A0ABW9P624_9LACO|nr:prephenate dehydrogenase [Companilactobacillus mishanensis]MQS44654.1 prephenate dehydrogenase [Companilactobacillus mishanensis]